LICGGAYWTWDAFTSGKIQTFVESNIKEKWAPTAEDSLATMYEMTERYGPAIICYRKLVEILPDNSPLAEKSSYRIAVCLSQWNKMPDALAAFDAFLEKYPNSEFRDVAQRRRAAIFNR